MYSRDVGIVCKNYIPSHQSFCAADFSQMFSCIVAGLSNERSEALLQGELLPKIALVTEGLVLG